MSFEEWWAQQFYNAKYKDFAQTVWKAARSFRTDGSAVWDGTIRIESDCTINGTPVRAGTVLRVNDKLPPPQHGPLEK